VLLKLQGYLFRNRFALFECSLVAIMLYVGIQAYRLVRFTVAGDGMSAWCTAGPVVCNGGNGLLHNALQCQSAATSETVRCE